MSLSKSNSRSLNPFNFKQIVGLGIGFAGLGILFLAWIGVPLLSNYWLTASLLFMSIGVALYTLGQYGKLPAGIKNNNIMFGDLTNRGISAWLLTILLTFVYICLYMKPEWLGLSSDQNTGLIGLFDPLSLWLKGKPASQWFVYGLLYTFAIIVFGIKFIVKYRHNRYQIIRTISVICFQLFFAFLIPEVLEAFNPGSGEKWFDKDIKNMWPLDYDFFFNWHIEGMSKNGLLGLFFLGFGLAMIFVISPILTYLYGKRWYCSWVCGCGGLAETAGDAFRHISDKSNKAWKIERWMIHVVLAFSYLMTIAVIFGYLGEDQSKYYLTKNSFTLIVTIVLLCSGAFYYTMNNRLSDSEKNNATYIVLGTVGAILFLFLINFLFSTGNAFFLDSYQFQSLYKLLIGTIFSGVIGVGFYPILGSRVWCRFGCPMAALLGIQQKLFSRFRITTNGGQCISCGNCSTYCEMGIDVRAYAQKGQNIVRASCVGCGVCSAVCPRGVLKLENGSVDLFSKTTKKYNTLVLESDVKRLS